MTLSDRPATSDQINQHLKEVQKQRESFEFKQRIEAELKSLDMHFEDEYGNDWEYRLKGNAEVVIVKCESSNARVDIPSFIGGCAVTELAMDSCSSLQNVKEIMCPDSITLIGYAAFRNSYKLESVYLPEDLDTFDSHWFNNCKALRHITLPGSLEEISFRIYDFHALESLCIGKGTKTIAPGSFSKSALLKLKVDSHNPHLSTDGIALYSKDWSTLFAFAVPCSKYKVADGCKVISEKAFYGYSCLQVLELPESLEEIGKFAFSRTSVEKFEAPSALKNIGEKAFYDCSKLQSVVLSDALEIIEDKVFANTPIEGLTIPLSVMELGRAITAGCDLSYSGEAATFRIQDGGVYHLDTCGGLYRLELEGKVFKDCIDPNATEYAIESNCVKVADGAFANHLELKQVEIPDGLKIIGEGAFKGCRHLEIADLPESVEYIGDEAFLDTSLKRLAINKNVTHIGSNAFITYGAHRGDMQPTLVEISIDEDNPSFEMSGSLLLRNLKDGKQSVVVCEASATEANVPSSVSDIEDYALNAIDTIKYLHVSDKIEHIGPRGVALEGFVDVIDVDVTEDDGVERRYKFEFPQTDRGQKQQYLLLSVPSCIDVRNFFRHFDDAITNASSFDMERAERLSIYEQAKHVTSRLTNPIYLPEARENTFRKFLNNKLLKICMASVKHDDVSLIDSLVDLGFITGDSILEIIDAIEGFKDATIVNHLLELKRTRFEQDAIDFDL
jgi:hypothetical protein